MCFCGGAVSLVFEDWLLSGLQQEMKMVSIQVQKWIIFGMHKKQVIIDSRVVQQMCERLSGRERVGVKQSQIFHVKKEEGGMNCGVNFDKNHGSGSTWSLSSLFCPLTKSTLLITILIYPSRLQLLSLNSSTTTELLIMFSLLDAGSSIFRWSQFSGEILEDVTMEFRSIMAVLVLFLSLYSGFCFKRLGGMQQKMGSIVKSSSYSHRYSYLFPYFFLLIQRIISFSTQSIIALELNQQLLTFNLHRISLRAGLSLWNQSHESRIAEHQIDHVVRSSDRSQILPHHFYHSCESHRKGHTLLMIAQQSKDRVVANYGQATLLHRQTLTVFIFKVASTGKTFVKPSRNVVVVDRVHLLVPFIQGQSVYLFNSEPRLFYYVGHHLESLQVKRQQLPRLITHNGITMFQHFYPCDLGTFFQEGGVEGFDGLFFRLLGQTSPVLLLFLSCVEENEIALTCAHQNRGVTYLFETVDLLICLKAPQYIQLGDPALFANLKESKFNTAKTSPFLSSTSPVSPLLASIQSLQREVSMEILCLKVLVLQLGPTSQTQRSPMLLTAMILPSCSRRSTIITSLQIRYKFSQFNMLGYLSLILMFHAAFSTLRWRKYVQANQQTFFLPLDILIQIALAVILAYMAILVHAKKFKPAKEFTQSKSYDSSFYRPNFRNLRTSRASLLLPYLKQRLGSESLDVSLRL